MKRPALILCAIACALALTPIERATAQNRARAQTMPEILEAAAPQEWRTLDPQNTLYLDIAAGRVVIELAPALAPNHVANIKTLVREGYFDGLSINRAQDNFVAQWGDPAEKEEDQRTVGSAKDRLPPEFVRTLTPELGFTRIADSDGYAPQVGFIGGMPAAADPRNRRAWGVHCYGSVGVGRDSDPRSGFGGELYAVIGHAPRALDRNVTLVGRVVEGMTILSTLPRGTGTLGFYERAEERILIRRIRVAADLPEREQLKIQTLRTDSASFAALVEARRNRRDAWYRTPAGHIDICNVPLPVRRAPE